MGEDRRHLFQGVGALIQGFMVLFHFFLKTINMNGLVNQRKGEMLYKMSTKPATG